MVDEKKKADPAPALEESTQSDKREGKVLILGSRRQGGTMGVVMFVDSQTAADTAAKALVQTGWAAVEVYTRATAYARQAN